MVLILIPMLSQLCMISIFFMEITQGLYENRPRLVKDQVEAVAKAKEQQRRLESQGQGLRFGSNSHQVTISLQDV